MRDYTIELHDGTSDDIAAITELLHRAYAPLLDAGMDYMAATQRDDVTRSRLESAACSWIAKKNGEIIGIISYYTERRREIFPSWFRRPDVGVFAQFAVEPSFQKRGVGRELLLTVESCAKEQGKCELACDTAENALHLRAYYANRGFREVATHRYPRATYTSVILSKTL